jgi:type IV pilus assembly protein PilX
VNYFAAARRKSAAFALRRKKQGGVVLILALILLVIISTVAILAVRGAISGEQVSNNLRVNAVATQAAETGLRYCENNVLAGLAPVLLLPLTNTTGIPSVWSSRANWTAANISTVTTAVANSADSAGRTMSTRPVCMAEEMRLPTSDQNSAGAAYLITSRGFSQDYQANSSGVATSGSEVWMQSILRY